MHSENVMYEIIKEVLDDNDSLSHHLASSKISSVYLYKLDYNIDMAYNLTYNLITTLLVQRYR